MKAGADDTACDDCAGGEAEETAEDHGAECDAEDGTGVEDAVGGEDVGADDVTGFGDVAGIDGAGAEDTGAEDATSLEVVAGALGATIEETTGIPGTEGEGAAELDCGAPGPPGPLPRPQEA